MFYLPDEYADITALIATGVAAQKAERAILSTTTAALGMVVADKWNFPATIINCMIHLPAGLLAAPNNDEETLCHAANFANDLCALFMSAAIGADLLVKTDAFNERYRTIFTGDVNKLAQLATATAGKFSDLAPGLEVDFSDSRFCQQLSKFASSIEAAQCEEALQTTVEE